MEEVSSPQPADVVVVGAGIAGLSAAALLAHAGLSVELLEAHRQSGGCAGTFRRGPYTFDVGATQVAGLEPGGSHHRLLHHLGVEPPVASVLDPACVVDLADGHPAVRIWHEPSRWAAERQQQFPGSELFWQLCSALHQTNWRFASRDPVLPPRSLWDLGQLLRALGPGTIASGLLSTSTVASLLQLCGCAGDWRLRRFLDLQLRLYSQQPANRTAALYGATVLAMGQSPLGLRHLEGSMQELSRRLEQALHAAGGQLRCRHRVSRLERHQQDWLVHGRIQPASGQRSRAGRGSGDSFVLRARDVVVSLPVQTLPELLGHELPDGYRRRLEALPDPSGALVFYGAVDRQLLPADCPGHLQLDWSSPGPLFVSVSQDGDGRAPAGQATVIASVFTPARPWAELEPRAYANAKAEAMAGIQLGLQRLLGLDPKHWRHGELATPCSFARWSGRPFGFVGGLGQHPSQFGPFGLASRTPLPGLWLCGDSIHPGEGTAAVSLSALTACRQLLTSRGGSLCV